MPRLFQSTTLVGMTAALLWALVFTTSTSIHGVESIQYSTLRRRESDAADGNDFDDQDFSLRKLQDAEEGEDDHNVFHRTHYKKSGSGGGPPKRPPLPLPLPPWLPPPKRPLLPPPLLPPPPPPYPGPPKPLGNCAKKCRRGSNGKRRRCRRKCRRRGCGGKCGCQGPNCCKGPSCCKGPTCGGGALHPAGRYPNGGCTTPDCRPPWCNDCCFDPTLYCNFHKYGPEECHRRRETCGCSAPKPEYNCHTLCYDPPEYCRINKYPEHKCDYIRNKCKCPKPPEFCHPLCDNPVMECMNQDWGPEECYHRRMICACPPPEPEGKEPSPSPGLPPGCKHFCEYELKNCPSNGSSFYCKVKLAECNNCEVGPPPGTPTPAPTHGPTVISAAPSRTDGTIFDVISEEEDFSTLTEAVIAAMLDDVLSHPGSYTLFAPTNEAFSFLPEKTLDRYFNVTWKEHLRDLLLYHLLNETVFSPQLMNDQTLTTLNGENITITKPAMEVNPRINMMARILVNEGLVDIPATNGIIQAIDDVLLPFSATWDIIEIAESIENCSTFVDLVEHAGLTDYLKDLGNSPVTVFVPSNAAFDEFINGTYNGTFDDLKDDPLLEFILQYHIVQGNNWYSSRLVNGLDLLTLADQTIHVTRYPTGGIKIGDDADLIVPDLLACNGVKHAINEVLIPKITQEPSSAPSMVPTRLPSAAPTESLEPSTMPSEVPSDLPSQFPSELPSDNPSDVPSDLPSQVPSLEPSEMPSDSPAWQLSINGANCSETCAGFDVTNGCNLDAQDAVNSTDTIQYVLDLFSINCSTFVESSFGSVPRFLNNSGRCDYRNSTGGNCGTLSNMGRAGDSRLCCCSNDLARCPVS